MLSDPPWKIALQYNWNSKIVNNNALHHPKAVIFGCEGTELSAAEKTFFRVTDPVGFILFARNCETLEQVKKLISDLRDTVRRSDAPVLIDQEGGRVQRLGPPNWRKAPSMRSLVDAVEAHDPSCVAEAVRLNARLIAFDLKQLGITVNCLPLLDIPQSGANNIIGDRAFGGDAIKTAHLGKACCEGLLQGGVLPVIKHIPGHGRSIVDTHEALPRVDVSRNILDETDFAPFRILSEAPWAMTAHVVYSVLDSTNPATLSSIVLRELIRKDFGFSGVLLSDDISMKALSGGLGERARKAIEAGCDIALHCNGVMSEMVEVAQQTSTITEDTALRIMRGEVLRQRSEQGTPFSTKDALDNLKGLTGGQI
jgi:beta-N-acetylhexosaminidase